MTLESTGPRLFPHVFADTVSSRPRAPAVVDAVGTFDYAATAAWADGLSARLRKARIAPEEPVGVCVRRGAGTATAFLGVLRAGGAYVPLDPEYPPARLELVARDAGLRLVVADERGAGVCRGLGLGVVPAGADASPREPAEAPTSLDVRPGQLAYIVYTSGSTGQPVGVAVSHEALAAHLERAAAAYELKAADVVLLALSPSFDASIELLVLTFAAGATLVIPDVDLRSIDALLEAIGTHRVTVAALPPPVWDAVVDLAGSSAEHTLGSLRLLVTGGQESRLDQVRRWRAAAPEARVLNVYGPSEAVITGSAHALAPEMPVSSGEGGLPIGRALRSTQLLLLDDDLERVQDGRVGEIFLGGRTLARGYTADPKRTAARFLPNPYASAPGGRMYRTGDLGRLRDDGSLDFLGRRDAQVKIRGFRIELAEVEAALAAHPAVTAAAAHARELEGDARLVGYVVLRSGASLSMNELRKFIEASLPPYAVPSVVVGLDELPTTPNGKIDRKALPDPAPHAEAGFVAPRSAREETIARIWSDVLGIESLGIREDFFELGGDSLLVTKAIGRLREELGRDIPVRALFDAPTVEEFAEFLESTADARATARTEVT